MTRITKENVQKYSENIVIGNGIMAKQLMFELKNHFSDISCISSLDFAPPSSLSTTSLNCLRGTEKGVSSLGDLLFESQQEFINFYKKYKPPGVSKSIEVQTWLEGGSSHAKWLRRYGDYESVKNLKFSKSNLSNPLACVEVEAYIIDTDLFFKWYDKQLCEINFVEAFIINISKIDSEYELTSSGGVKYKCKRLFLCTSYMTDQFLSLCDKVDDRVELSKHKKVYGSYLSHNVDKDLDYGLDFSNSFSLSFNFTRLIYRKESNQLLVSLNDFNKSSFLNDAQVVKKDYMELVMNLNLTKLPEFNKWKIEQGIRSKGYKRIPFSKEISRNLFITSGLYKNAFSFSYFFTKNILHTIYE